MGKIITSNCNECGKEFTQERKVGRRNICCEPCRKERRRIQNKASQRRNKSRKIAEEKKKLTCQKCQSKLANENALCTSEQCIAERVERDTARNEEKERKRRADRHAMMAVRRKMDVESAPIAKRTEQAVPVLQNHFAELLKSKLDESQYRKFEEANRKPLPEIKIRDRSKGGSRIRTNY